MRKECTLEWVDDNGNVISNNITKSPNDAIKEHIDVIEVVLCKDCKWHKCGGLPCPLDLCETLGDDGFCSRGERRVP